MATPATAAPSDISTIERVVKEGPTQWAMYVHSAAMDKTVKVQVLTPAASSTPRPSQYMLSGLGEENPEHSIWLIKTDAVDFFKSKNVNVVLPLAGNGSFYTDWQQDDPALGRNRWETFLTEELPPLVDTQFNGNGVRGIAGLSMGAGSALTLASRNPGFYRSVGSYSGCYSTTDPLTQGVSRGIVAAFGGNADNMWGQPGDPDWAAHDVLLHANGLRNTAVYVSVGSGLPGPYDAPEYPGNKDPVDRIVVGGAIEAGSLWCTQRLATELANRNIPATFDFEKVGTHAWPYWIDQLHKSWPVLAGGLGVTP
ncbi:mycolyltransferase [Williamsia sp. 1138]|uniref:alpha/beta hydrolase n=1 Tax=Williamsia sp. 1138 TaxID=1903117 RepID=UPI000B9BD406|nr:alpha/beta hydrolase family protein [Williamsia sp. 1138]OZG27118.1 mycolyltransferase [Williamsia sp. 1138]